MDYPSALRHLLSLVDFERVHRGSDALPRYDLSRMEEFLRRLGSPHLRVPTIHIAGTKGKGSTAAMITSILTEQGYITGLFTSPHLHTFRERIRTGLSPISEEDFASLVERLWEVVQGLNEERPHDGLTTFEMLVAMAFSHFVERRADFQVLEVGLGGRLDATNTVRQPLVCVITPVSLDHTAILGATVSQIAREKAGIIKPDSVVVAAPQPPEALVVIQEACQAQGVPLVRVAQEYAWERESASLEGQSFRLQGPNGEWYLTTPLLGRHQLENAATAVAAVEALQRQGVTISQRSVEEGLRSARWPGRVDVLQRHPLVVADGAHNPSSMARLQETVEEELPCQHLYLVLGASADKDLAGMVEELVRLKPALVVATRSRHPRALPARAVALPFAAREIAVTEVGEVGEATRFAMAHAGEGDLVLATGSLFVVAEAIEEVRHIQPELYPELPRSPRVL